MVASTRHAAFRFYAELNDLLPRAKRQRDIDYRFSGKLSVKDAIESLGVPHTEVDLVLVNGRSVDFGYHLEDGDRIAVYPVFEGLDVSPLVCVRAAPLRDLRFVLDCHLGKLARRLRLLGFDCRYHRDFSDERIVRCALEEKRVVLTCDRGILKRGPITHGYCVRSRDPAVQVGEVLQRFDLHAQARPFTRCTMCNGSIVRVATETVADRLDAGTRRHYDDFWQCRTCGRVYWRGSHFDRMAAFVERLLRSRDHEGDGA